MSESRYEDCEILKDGERGYLGIRLPVEIPPRPDDRFHTVVTGDRLDVLAQRYLGDASRWCIVADYNDLFYPFELETGTLLRIPSTEYVQVRILD